MNEPARNLPQLAVACPTCQAPAGELCHGGTRPRRHDTHQARTTAWTAAARTVTESLDELFRRVGPPAAQYPEPGSEIPDQPGYVVAECRHRVAASEWRAGFRTCERCPAAEQTTEVPQ